MSLEDRGYRKIMDKPEHKMYTLDPPKCLRCPSTMQWIHGSWQCPKCKYKEDVVKENLSHDEN